MTQNNQNKFKSGYKTPITISDAILHIEKRDYLLPAIQRKFVWSSEQIERLFDSIMRGYPINTFMYWHVTDPTAKNNYKFYEFLKEYREFFQDENSFIPTVGYRDFMAIIDGQQRLTSLYLGLKGTYAYKMPRKRWKNDEESLPTRKLYLILNRKINADDERNMEYNFKFLSSEDIKKFKSGDIFLVSDIYKYQSEEDLDNFVEDLPTDYKRALRKLRKVIFDDTLINYYQEENQDLDSVLDIFIRTNSGGEPLSFSDLLMSFTTAMWAKDTRKEFKRLVDEVYTCDFKITNDFILKCCLVLFCDNVKFAIKNFSEQSVHKFEENWEKTKKCIVLTFTLLHRWGFNNANFKAKNAAIPIVYYIFYHHIGEEILNEHKHVEEKESIRKWLCISLVKGVFGGQSDSVLTTIRKVLNENADVNTFPFEKIKEAFANDDAKSLSMSDEVIDNILQTQKDDANAYVILSLLYSFLHYDEVQYHKDHLHPAVKFKKLKESDFSSKEEYDFYVDPNNWNSILNLQLLSSSSNESKNDEDLKDWVANKNIDLRMHLIPENVSLDFRDFPQFIEARRGLLKTTLRNIIG